MTAVFPSFDARRQTPSQMLLSTAQEATIHEAQKSLRNQLRKNPHSPERRPAKSYARMSDRTNGFFCGRLKRLALSSGRAVRRDVLGRRSRQSATRMDTAEHTPTNLVTTVVESSRLVADLPRPEKLFFSWRAPPRESIGVHHDTPQTAVETPHLPSRQVCPEQSSGGRSQDRPPATHHNGGWWCGEGTTHPPSWWVAGSGGGLRA